MDPTPSIPSLQKWIVLFMVTLHRIIASGCRSSRGVYMEPMIAAYHLESFGQIGLADSISVIISCFLCPTISFLVDFFGVQMLSVFTLLSLGLSLIGIGNRNDNNWKLLYLANTVIEMAEVSIYVTSNVAITRSFEKNAGKALGITVLGMSLGGSVIPLVVHYSIGNYGFGVTLSVLGATTMAVGIDTKRKTNHLSLNLPNNSAEVKGAEKAKNITDPLIPKLQKGLMKKLSNWLLSFKVLTKLDFLVFSVSTFVMENTKELQFKFLPVFLAKSNGVSNDAAVWLQTALMLSQVPGGLLLGWLTDMDKMDLKPHILTATTYILAATFIFLIQFMPEIISLTLCVSASGFFIVARSLTTTMILVQFFGKDLLASGLAIEEIFKTAGRILAPIIFSALLDRQSNYELSWDFGALSCLVSAFLIFAAGYLNTARSNST